MSDLLDTLHWKPWPKDPGWVYAEIDGVARVGKRAGEALYFVRTLDEEGAPGAWHYTSIERKEVVKILGEAMRAARPKSADH